MIDGSFKLKGKIEIFPQKGGWYFVRVPKEITNIIKEHAIRGLIAITSSVGKTKWKTSLLPMGDGSHFIALNAKVMRSEGIKLGDIVKVEFSLR